MRLDMLIVVITIYSLFKVSNIQIQFTGERMIPEHNQGAAFYYEHICRYLFSAQYVHNKVVLDVGSGSGYGSHLLKTHGQAKEVYGIDNSSEAIDYSRDKYRDPNIHFNVDNAETLSTIMDNSIDVVVCFELIEHIHKQGDLLSHIVRVLRENGVCILSTPNKVTYPQGNIFHVHELAKTEFHLLVKEYFEHVDLYNQNFLFVNTIFPENIHSSAMLSESSSKTSSINYFPGGPPKEPQYFIAVLSKNISPEELSVSTITPVIDHFYDMSNGVTSLGDLYKQLQMQEHLPDIEHMPEVDDICRTLVEETQLLEKKIEKSIVHVAHLESKKDRIIKSQFYKYWQGYRTIFKKIKNLITT